MKNLKMTVLLCFVCLAGLASARGEAQPSQSAENGKSVYMDKCTRCHGRDGRGQTTVGRMTEAPDLTDPQWQAARSRARMIASVTRGRGGMPAFGKKLSKDEIAAAVAYVRTLKR